MKIYYYSAAVRIGKKITCTVGLKVMTNKTEIVEAEIKSLFSFAISRYLNSDEMFAFGKITKKDYDNKTNLNITLNY